MKKGKEEECMNHLFLILLQEYFYRANKIESNEKTSRIFLSQVENLGHEVQNHTIQRPKRIQSDLLCGNQEKIRGGKKTNKKPRVVEQQPFFKYQNPDFYSEAWLLNYVFQSCLNGRVVMWLFLGQRFIRTSIALAFKRLCKKTNLMKQRYLIRPCSENSDNKESLHSAPHCSKLLMQGIS